MILFLSGCCFGAFCCVVLSCVALRWFLPEAEEIVEWAAPEKIPVPEER